MRTCIFGVAEKNNPTDTDPERRLLGTDKNFVKLLPKPAFKQQRIDFCKQGETGQCLRYAKLEPPSTGAGVDAMSGDTAFASSEPKVAEHTLDLEYHMKEADT